MPLNRHKLTSVAGSNSSFTLYHYPAVTESEKTILEDKFITSCIDIFNVGDTLKVYKYDGNGNITDVYEMLITKVDQLLRQIEKVVLSHIDVTERALKVSAEKKVLQKTTTVINSTGNN